MADDVAGLLGITRAHVMGVSMGGYIAQEIARRRPETVDRLVLYALRPAGPYSGAQ